MKFTPCLSILLPRTPLPEALAVVRDIGYDAVETWRVEPSEELAAAVRETGVSIVSVVAPFFTLNDPAARGEYVSRLSEALPGAAKMGVGKMITQVGEDRPGIPREEQRRSIVDGLRACLPALEEHGVILMIEPLNPIFDHRGTYLTHSAEAFDICREVDSPFVKVCYDIYHQQITEGNLIPTITKNLDCIAHLHAAGHPGRHELDKGETDYRFVFDAVDKAGYAGYCGLEYAPTEPGEDSMRRMLALYGR